jgi:hypothetical protein
LEPHLGTTKGFKIKSQNQCGALRSEIFLDSSGFFRVSCEEVLPQPSAAEPQIQSDYLAQRRKGRKGKQVVFSTKGRNLS